jgi:chromosome segregation ATPase
MKNTCYYMRQIRRRLPDLHPRINGLESALASAVERERLAIRERAVAKAASTRAEQQVQELATALCREQQRSRKLKEENSEYEQRFTRQANTTKEAQARLAAKERELTELRQRSQEELEAERTKCLNLTKEHQKVKGGLEAEINRLQKEIAAKADRLRERDTMHKAQIGRLEREMGVQQQQHRDTNAARQADLDRLTNEGAEQLEHMQKELASSKENFRDYAMRTKVEFERGCFAVAAENEQRCAQALAELRRVQGENVQLRRVIESTPTRPDEWQECTENTAQSRVQRIFGSTPGAPQQSQTPPRYGSAIFE